MILLGLLLTCAGAADWELVKGAGDGVGGLSYERIGDTYLGAGRHRVVAPQELGPDPATSRLVVGAPQDNALAAALLLELGVGVAEGGLEYAGATVPAGEGLTLRLGDLDGGGELWIFTGADEAGVFTCMTTRLGPGGSDWIHTRRGEVVQRGKHPLRVKSERALVTRLDRRAELLIAEAEAFPRDEGALHVALGCFGYPEAFGRVGYGDLLEYGRWLQGAGRAEVRAAGEFFGERDLSQELRTAWGACVEKLGVSGAAPHYVLLHGPARGTNACTFGPDPYSGRPRVMLSLPALARGRHWDAAILHESVHTLQGEIGPTLADRAAHEGVATALSQVLDPSIEDADALFYSPDELAAARAHEAALVELVRERAASTDLTQHAPLMTLGVTPAEIPGAPARGAYYVAWLAARAWLEGHPDAPPAALLRVPAVELLDALP